MDMIKGYGDLEIDGTDWDIPGEILEIFKADMVELLEGEEKHDLQQFANPMDWITLLMIVGIRHAFPKVSGEDAVIIAEAIGRRISLPGYKHRWFWALDRLERWGMKQMISRIKMELDRSVHGSKAK
jgi:hypothetical protein